MSVQPLERFAAMYDEDEKFFTCPACKGHGEVPSQESWARDGKLPCGQCTGWGWVTKKNSECIHEWREILKKEADERGIEHHGMFYNLMECKKCRNTRVYDSS